MLGRERLQDDVVILLINDCARSLIDFKVLAQPARDNYLNLSRQVNETVSVFCVALHEPNNSFT